MLKPMKIDGVDIMEAFLGPDWETNEHTISEMSEQFGPDWKQIITRKVRQHYNDLKRNKCIDTSKRKTWYLSKAQQESIIEDYQNLTPVQSLAKKHHVSRVTIYKLLKRHGVDTKRQKLPVSCSTCGKILYRTKAKIRKQQNHFCDPKCYGAFIQAGSSLSLTNTECTLGRRRARQVVSQVYDLHPGHVVHHEDHNPLNNNLWNLKVFATQGDHIRYHRGFDVIPVWDGSV